MGCHKLTVETSNFETLAIISPDLCVRFQDSGVEFLHDLLRPDWRYRKKRIIVDSSQTRSLQCEDNSGGAAECGICFGVLVDATPYILVDAEGSRVCRHYVCEYCAENMQHPRWTSRIGAAGTVCPFCRTPYVNFKRLPDPTRDPLGFFQAASEKLVPDGECVMTLRGTTAALSALLPVDQEELAECLAKHYWPKWCSKGSDVLSEVCFFQQMWPWLSDNMSELMVGVQRASPPGLHDPVAWFKYFDYDRCHYLSKREVLRGCAKTFDFSTLATQGCLAHRKYEGVKMLHALIDSCWTRGGWPPSVTLNVFEGPGGLAEHLVEYFEMRVFSL